MRGTLLNVATLLLALASVTAGERPGASEVELMKRLSPLSFQQRVDVLRAESDPAWSHAVGCSLALDHREEARKWFRSLVERWKKGEASAEELSRATVAGWHFLKPEDAPLLLALSGEASEGGLSSSALTGAAILGATGVSDRGLERLREEGLASPPGVFASLLRAPDPRAVVEVLTPLAMEERALVKENWQRAREVTVFGLRCAHAHLLQVIDRGKPPLSPAIYRRYAEEAEREKLTPEYICRLCLEGQIRVGPRHTALLTYAWRTSSEDVIRVLGAPLANYGDGKIAATGEKLAPGAGKVDIVGTISALLALEQLPGDPRIEELVLGLGERPDLPPVVHCRLLEALPKLVSPRVDRARDILLDGLRSAESSVALQAAQASLEYKHPPLAPRIRDICLSVPAGDRYLPDAWLYELSAFKMTLETGKD